MMGMPIVGLATTEMATTVENGVSGFVDTRLNRLIERMQMLRQDPGLARELGESARKYALERFHIERFKKDWDAVLRQVTGRRKEAVLRAGGVA